MALTRRSVQRMSGSIWPGFVDAMTALLLVLMFVLSIFMIVQGILRETITGQESELDQLAAEVTSLSQALGLSQQQTARLEDDLASLQSESNRQAALISNLTGQIDAQSRTLAERDAARLLLLDRVEGRRVAADQDVRVRDLVDWLSRLSCEVEQCCHCCQPGFLAQGRKLCAQLC